MSDFEEKLDKYSRIMVNVLRAIGCLPTQDNILSTYITLALTLYGSGVTFYSMYLVWPDSIEEVAYNVSPFLASTLLFLKMLNFTVHRKKMFELLTTVKKKFWKLNADSPGDEREIIISYNRYMFMCCFAQAFVMFSSSPLWMLKPLAEMLWVAFKHPDNFRTILPFENWMPFHIDPHTHPYYEIIYILQIITTYYITCGMASVGCIYYYIVLNACAQFKIVQMRILNFNKTDIGSECSFEEQGNKLRKAVEHHQFLLTYCQDIETVMTCNLFLEVSVGILFLCSAGFLMTLFPGNFYIYLHSGLCLSAGLIEIFLHCLPANMLTIEGLDVGYAAYNSEWYNAPLHIQKLFIFIIMRAQRPVILTAGKLKPVSVETYESITRSAASYFTVLTSMRE